MRYIVTADTEQVSLATSLAIRIRQVVGSDVGQDTGCRDCGFSWFL
jgi:hypothetical protein